MMLTTLASIASSSPGMVGSCDRLLRPVQRRRRRVGEEVEGDEERAGEQAAGAQLARARRAPPGCRSAAGAGSSRSAPGGMSTILTPSRWASRRIVTGAENSKVCASTCALIVRDLADRDAAELHRRARRQPAHRVLEDQHVGLRIARRRLEGAGAVAEQREDGVRLGRRQHRLASPAVSKAMPPIRIESSDCVCTLSPVAESDTSIPLACQKRVFGLTYWS